MTMTRYNPQAVPPAQINARLAALETQNRNLQSNIDALELAVAGLVELARATAPDIPAGTPDDWQRFVFFACGVDLRRKSERRRDIFNANCISAMGLQTLFGLSLPACGVVQGVDHSTVFYRINRAKQRPRLVTRYQQLARRFQEIAERDDVGRAVESMRATA